MKALSKDTFWAAPREWAALITSDDVPTNRVYTERPVKVAEGVAVIDVSGVIMREEDDLCEQFGACSTVRISRQLALAVADPQIKSVLLYVNSPGGMVNGTAELADQIFAARSVKPVVSYISGDGFSAGYWLASQADRIFMHSSAGAGAIGVCLPVSGDYSEWLISDVSPNKYPEIATAESKSQMQRYLNELGLLFVRAVARGRGVTEQEAASRYGGGDIFIAAQAVERGLADAVSTFEQALAYAKSTTPQQTEQPDDAEVRTGSEPVTVEKTESSAPDEVPPTGNVKNEIGAKDMDKPAAALRAEMVDSSEITVEWLKNNLPDIVEQIVMVGAELEQARQTEIDAMTPADDEEKLAISAARKDRKITAHALAFDLRVKAQAKAAAKTEAIAKQREADNAAVNLPTATAPTEEKSAETIHAEKVIAAMKRRKGIV